MFLTKGKYILCICLCDRTQVTTFGVPLLTRVPTSTVPPGFFRKNPTTRYTHGFPGVLKRSACSFHSRKVRLSVYVYLSPLYVVSCKSLPVNHTFRVLNTTYYVERIFPRVTFVFPYDSIRHTPIDLVPGASVLQVPSVSTDSI